LGYSILGHECFVVVLSAAAADDDDTAAVEDDIGKSRDASRTDDEVVERYGSWRFQVSI